MASVIEGRRGSFTAGAAIAQHLRVYLTSEKLAIAGLTQQDIGTINQESFADGDIRAVNLINAQGTTKMVAAAAIAVDAVVYSAAGGKIDDAPAGLPIGVAREAAAADDDLLEVIRFPNPVAAGKAAQVKTAAYTVLAAESGSIFTTVGAGGTVLFTMPAAVVGLEYFFQVGAAQELRIDPDGTETIALPSTGVPGAAGKYLTANLAGETVHVLCSTAGSWHVYGFTGTWTAEA